jgi:hypothetical protein
MRAPIASAPTMTRNSRISFQSIKCFDHGSTGRSTALTKERLESLIGLANGTLGQYTQTQHYWKRLPRQNQELGWEGLEPSTNALKGRCSTIELPTPEQSTESIANSPRCNLKNRLCLQPGKFARLFVHSPRFARTFLPRLHAKLGCVLRVPSRTLGQCSGRIGSERNGISLRRGTGSRTIVLELGPA